MSANLADGFYAGSRSPQGAASGRPVQVMDQLGQLEQVVQEGLKLQSEFEQRLSSVLRSEPQLTEGANLKEKETLVPLADRIGALMYSIRNLNSGYSSMMRRLEI